MSKLRQYYDCKIWVLLFAVCVLHFAGGLHIDDKGYDLPVVPPELVKLVQPKVNQKIADIDKYIPRIAWIAVKNITDAHASHMDGANGFIARNHQWKINFCGNYEKDLFMEENFQGSSILWAYKILNPAIGVSKVEIWRLAVLYMYGGMYMDDDANIAVPLDEVVQPTDKFICGKEPYNFDDRCFTPDFPLSNHSMVQRFGVAAAVQPLFDDKFFFNWALFSMPGHPLLVRIMQHVVALLKTEYLNDSKVKLSPMDHRGKLLMCATTFPITHAAREMVLEQQQQQRSQHSHVDTIGADSGDILGLRVGGVYFKEYGADMKAWNNDWRPDRWVKQIHKHRMPYLRAYAPPRPEAFEGKAIQGKGQREIYLVRNATRHAFPDFDTFIAMKLTLDDVHMVHQDVMHVIPLGLPLPHKDARVR
mmetsp:Transcript_9840/g.16217  ORF Transcript_9840/g.16217 Transcript_9840/m.16217 type:complete len:419 (-) Transcript_9840:137-1393(-)